MVPLSLPLPLVCFCAVLMTKYTSCDLPFLCARVCVCVFIGLLKCKFTKCHVIKAHRICNLKGNNTYKNWIDAARNWKQDSIWLDWFISIWNWWNEYIADRFSVNSVWLGLESQFYFCIFLVTSALWKISLTRFHFQNEWNLHRMCHIYMHQSYECERIHYINFLSQKLKCVTWICDESMSYEFYIYRNVNCCCRWCS